MQRVVLSLKLQVILQTVSVLVQDQILSSLFSYSILMKHLYLLNFFISHIGVHNYEVEGILETN